MPTYVTEYQDDLRRLGPERFLRLHADPVFIIKGLAGTLKEERATGSTVVTTSSDVVMLGKLVGRVFPIIKGKDTGPGTTIVVGRTSDNDVPIPEYSISKKHCFLATVGKELRLTDCGSTNGTVVDGELLEAKKPRALIGGETVVLGRFALVFHFPSGFVQYLQENQ